MEDKKIKILYDGTVMQEYYGRTAARTGVYFVVMNVFKGLIADDRFEVSVYCKPHTYINVKKLLEEDSFKDKNIPIANIATLSDRKERFLKKYYDWYNSLSHKPDWERYIKKGITLPIVLGERYERVQKGKQVRFDEEFDAFFSPVSQAMPKEIMQYKGLKKFNILYDIMPYRFPENYREMKRSNNPYSLLIEKQMHDISNNIYSLAISEYTKKDYKELVPPEMYDRIKVALIACDERFKKCTDQSRIDQVKERYHVPTGVKYIFSLCTLEPRKNLLRAVRCFISFIKENNITDLYFVLGGAHWDNFIGRLEKEIKNLDDYKKYIIRAGYIEDEDVPVLYSDAEWFVYTSQYEGFGMPPLEAMSCGCPVISSNNTSLPEVVGDASIMIDWDSDEQHVEAYKKFYYSKELRDEYAKKGYERAQLFSWGKTTKVINDYVIEVLSKNGEG